MARKPAKTLASVPATTTPPPQRAGKRDLALALMRRPGGATFDELTSATGWLPHSTRAVISGLRKQGLVIDRTQCEGRSCYAIVEAA